MKVDQLAVFLENKSGRLAAITKTLSDNNINIRALSVADTADFGILRLIVDDTEKATRVLKDEGFTVGKAVVIAVEVADRPGGLAKVLGVLHEAGLNVEYMYAFVRSDWHADAALIKREQRFRYLGFQLGHLHQAQVTAIVFAGLMLRVLERRGREVDLALLQFVGNPVRLLLGVRYMLRICRIVFGLVPF